MSNNPQFAIHISVVDNGSDYNVSCIFGNNSFKMDSSGGDISTALFSLLNSLTVNTVFALILINPQISLWPIPHNHQLLQSIGHLYDLHFECGERRNVNGAFEGLYALTQIGSNPNNIKTYESVAKYYELAIENILVDLSSNGQLDFLIKNPGYSAFPFNSISPNTAPKAIPSSAPRPAEIPKKDLPRRLPSDIIGVSHPQCQNVCTSWDHFGKVKCKNMCAWRTEL